MNTQRKSQKITMVVPAQVHRIRYPIQDSRSMSGDNTYTAGLLKHFDQVTMTRKTHNGGTQNTGMPNMSEDILFKVKVKWHTFP